MTDIEVVLNAWEQNYVQVLAVQGESQGRTIIATLIDRAGQTDGTFSAASIDRPIDLTEVSARLYCIKPDGTVTFSDGTITDAANGIASFVLPYQATAAAGDVECQILLTKPDNSTLKTIGLHLSVQASDLEGAAESTSEFSALIVALNKADEAAATATQAAADAQQAVEDAQSAISVANTASVAATQAAQTATTAAGTANTAAVNAQSLYQMIDPTTGQMAYVTNIIRNLEAYIFRDAITAQPFDDLNKSAQNFDALNITALDFDINAKTILGVS